MYALLLALIYLAFISLGLPDSLLGAGWPSMHVSLGVPTEYMGFVSMIISGGTIVSSLLSEAMTKKIGTKYVTVISVALTAAALLGFSFSDRFWMLCAFAVPYGLGAGAIDASLNNYVAVHYTSRHMSWLHCFWGVGTIISPYIMSYALTKSYWGDGYRTVSYIQFAIAAVLAATLFVWKANAEKEEKKSAKLIGIRGALGIKGVPFVLIGFFAYCAAESTAMLWASSFFVEIRGYTEESAAAFASMFFIGMTVGRFISGFISNKAGDRNMIRFGAGLAAVGIILLLIPVGVTSLIGFTVFGLGCAPIYPSIIHSTPESFGEDNSQAIIGVQMACAYTGSTFMPPLFGLIASKTTFYITAGWLFGFMAIAVVMLELCFRFAAGGGAKKVADAMPRDSENSKLDFD